MKTMDILNQFGINPILLAAQVVNFLILLWILNKLLYKPVLKALEERKEKIEDSLKNAEEIEKKLHEANETIDKMMVKASSDIQRMMDEAKKEIGIMKEEGKLQAEEVALQIVKRGEESARAEMDRKGQELMARMAEIVALGMEKVTGRSFNSKNQKEIIGKEIKNLS